MRQHKDLRGVVVNGIEHRIGLFADDVIVYLEQPDKSLPALMKLLEPYGHLSGYKINDTKTQILTFNYTPSKEVQESFHFNWNLKKMKYSGITITKGIPKQRS